MPMYNIYALVGGLIGLCCSRYPKQIPDEKEKKGLLGVVAGQYVTESVLVHHSLFFLLLGFELCVDRLCEEQYFVHVWTTLHISYIHPFAMR